MCVGVDRGYESLQGVNVDIDALVIRAKQPVGQEALLMLLR